MLLYNPVARPPSETTKLIDLNESVTLAESRAVRRYALMFLHRSPEIHTRTAVHLRPQLYSKKYTDNIHTTNTIVNQQTWNSSYFNTFDLIHRYYEMNSFM